MTDPRSQTATLLSRLHEGDQQALHTLLQRDLPWIEELVRRRLGPKLRAREETVDLVQDAMVAILRDGPRFVVRDQGGFRALVARLVENQIRDRHRWHQRDRRSPDRESSRPAADDSVIALDAHHPSPDSPSEHAARREEEDLIRLALDLLDPDDRQAIVLREFDDLPFAEVGARLGVAENAARMRFQRALPRLARVVERLRAGRIEQALADASRESTSR